MIHAHAPGILGLHALGALSTDEAAAIERHLAECATCRAELAASREALAALTLLLPPVAPSPALRARLLAEVATERASLAEDGKGGGAFDGAIAGAASVSVAGGASLGGATSATDGAPPDDLARRQESARRTHPPPAVDGTPPGSGAPRRRPPRRAPFLVALSSLALATAAALALGLWGAGERDGRRTAERLLVEAQRERAVEAARSAATLAELRRESARDAERARVAESRLAVVRARPLALVPLRPPPPPAARGHRVGPADGAVGDATARVVTAASADGHILWDKGRNTWLLVAFALPAPPDDKDYQLWFLQGPRPISGGVMPRPADGRVEAAIRVPDDLHGLTAAALTLEPRGGVASPTGAPLLVGAL